MKLILTVLPVYFAQITNGGKSLEIRCLQIKCHRWTNNIGSLNTDNMIGGIDYKKKTLPSTTPATPHYSLSFCLSKTFHFSSFSNRGYQ